MIPNQYRCETCKNMIASENRKGFLKCNLSNYLLNSNTNIIEMTRIVGCASHSEFQSERDSWTTEELIEHEKLAADVARDKLLDKLERWMNYKLLPPNNVPKTSEILCCSVKEMYELIEELRQAGEP